MICVIAGFITDLCRSSASGPSCSAWWILSAAVLQLLACNESLYCTRCRNDAAACRMTPGIQSWTRQCPTCSCRRQQQQQLAAKALWAAGQEQQGAILTLLALQMQRCLSSKDGQSAPAATSVTSQQACSAQAASQATLAQLVVWVAMLATVALQEQTSCALAAATARQLRRVVQALALEMR
jgi:hypothetical protein